jgi:O-antigen ligase
MKTSFATSPAGDPPSETRTKERRSKRDVASRAVNAVRGDAKVKDGWLYAAGAAFFAMVLLAPNLLVTANAAGGGASGEGTVLRQVAYILILITSIIAAVRQGEGAKSLMLPWSILLMLGWCWLSLVWAVNPEVAARRLTLTTVIAWNTFIIAQAAGYERTIAILRVAFVGVLLASYAVVALNPSLGVHEMLDGDINTALIGNWRGLLGHKNIAGSACAMTILLFMFDAKQIKGWIRILVIAAAGYFLFRTQSKTSAGMLGIALICGWIFVRYDDKIRTFSIPLIMFGTAIFWFVSSVYQGFVTSNFLNPAFFTGRGFIWDAMLRYSADHLLLGAGYGSFWQAGLNSPVLDYAKGFVATVSTGHNGYLDLLVTIGLPGLLLVVLITIVWPMAKLLLTRMAPQRGALALALLLFGIGHNITESSLLERDALVGVMMLVAIAFVHNWGVVGGRLGKKVGGGDIFAALAQRRSEKR